MNSDLADPSLEGDLSKYTNVIKGYQKRYFAIDSEKGVLNYYYYQSGKVRHNAPKATIPLQNSVIIPSEDDEALFAIHNFINSSHSVVYLKAKNSRERLTWIESLNQVSKHVKKSTNSDSVNGTSLVQPALANQCSICLDNCKQPVATPCGHIFCKNCIEQWIALKSKDQTCPLCHRHVSKFKLLRLFVNELPSEETVRNEHVGDPNQSTLSDNSSVTDTVQLRRNNSLHDLQSRYLEQQTRQTNLTNNQPYGNIAQVANTVINLFLLLIVFLAFIISPKLGMAVLIGCFIYKIIN